MVLLSSYTKDNPKETAEEKSSEQSILSPGANSADNAAEAEPNAKEQNLRPSNFNAYIGQEKLKQILNISISAARKRKNIASVGHVMLYGPPGLGKTSCAYLLANELGTSAKIFSAPALDKPKDIVGILMSLNQGDVLFIDEIHRLNKVTEELLYPAMEDFQVDLSTGKDSSSGVMRIDINPFILVGATTELGSISAPLRDRFIHVQRMEYYSVVELAKIIEQSARILQIGIEASASASIASRSRGTPRIANRLLRLVRDFAQHLDLNQIDLETANRALDSYRIDPSGLDQMDRKILETLLDKYNGGPVGLDTLATSVAEDRATIEDYYEPFLIQSGFLQRTPRGRAITDLGRKYLQTGS